MKDQKIDSNERRKFIRHPVCFPIKYKVLRKGTLFNFKEEVTTTKNISEGGLMFSSSKSAPLNSQIVARIPFMDKVFNVRAKVVYCRKMPANKLYDVGVSFVTYHDAFKVKLIEQMYLISEYRDLRSMQAGREISMEEASEEWVKRYAARFRRLYW